MSLKNQARQLAALQYNPQIQALLGLRHDANTAYGTEVAQAIATAAGLKQGAREARPVTQKIYGQAEGTRRAANSLAANTLAALPADSPFRAAFGIEDAGARTRFGEARAGALHELTQRMLEADSGRAYDISAAGQHRRESLSKIGQQLVGVRGQQGKYTATTLQSLRADRAAANAKARQDSQANRLALWRLTGVDPVTGKKSLDFQKTHGLGGGGGKLTKDKASVLALSVLGAHPIQHVVRPYHGVTPTRHIAPDAQGAAIDQITIAAQLASQSKKPASLRHAFIIGFHDKKTGVTIPKISHAGPIPASHLIDAAFDIAAFGSLSPKNRRRLRGVRLPRSWIRRPRRYGSTNYALTGNARVR